MFIISNLSAFDARDAVLLHPGNHLLGDVDLGLQVFYLLPAVGVRYFERAVVVLIEDCVNSGSLYLELVFAGHDSLYHLGIIETWGD